MKMTEEILYDKELKIISRPQADAHHLIIGGKYLIVLERGVLDELSRTPVEGLRGKLNAINPDSDSILRRGALSYEKLGWALTQARLIELELELNQAYHLK